MERIHSTRDSNYVNVNLHDCTIIYYFVWFQILGRIWRMGKRESRLNGKYNEPFWVHPQHLKPRESWMIWWLLWVMQRFLWEHYFPPWIQHYNELCYSHVVVGVGTHTLMEHAPTVCCTEAFTYSTVGSTSMYSEFCSYGHIKLLAITLWAKFSKFKNYAKSIPLAT